VSNPEHFSYPPNSGGWPPPGEWPPQYQQQQYQQYQYQPPPPPRRRPGRVAAAVIGGGIAVLVLVGGGGFAAGWSLRPVGSAQQGTAGNTSPYLPFAPGTGSQPGDGSTGSGSGSNGSGSDGSGSDGSGAVGISDSAIAAVAAKVDPALVDINTVLGDENGAAAGTGVVISSDGVVLTNNHVVAGATSITVTDIGNHNSYRAAVVGYDRSGDIAVLRLSGASGLTTATLAAGASVQSGDPVVAIGNAGGTGGTPSAVGGVVSALNQSITASDESSGSSEQLTGLIEVNADIEAGDSGGPLLTPAGQVIGIDTAASAGFQYQAAGGDGFAIPIGTATTIADQIRAGKASSKVHIGATAYLGVEVTGGGRGEQSQSGPAVLGVVEGSPAAAAGLARGDVIQSVAGTTVDSPTTLTNVLDGYHPGDREKVAWTDVNGQSHTSTVKLGTGPVG
jgi:S1-C subfamily serine protease